MAAGYILGILIAVYAKSRYLPAAAGMLLIGTLLLLRHKEKEGQSGFRPRIVFRMLLVVLLFLLGWGSQCSQQQYRERYLPDLKDGMPLSVQGRLSDKEYKNERYIYYLTSCIIGCNSNENSLMTPVPCNRIMVYSDSDSYSIGEILVLNGTIELWSSAVNEGNFDAKAYYESQKIDFKLVDGEVIAVYGKPDLLQERLYQLRMRFKEVYSLAMDSSDSGILATMVLGDKSLLDTEIKQLYQKAGISHILAISGLHISVIGMTLYRFLRRMGIGFIGAGILAGGMMTGYGMMVGMGASVQRAVCMFLLLLTAQALGRSYDSLNALALAALLLLWANPELLFYAGFLFSFAAVLGVVWVGDAMQTENQTNQADEYSRKSGGGKLRISLAIQLATLPLTAWYYFEIPVYSILVNLAVLPLMGLVLFLGVTGGIVGLWSLHAAKWMLFPCHLILSGYDKLCRSLIQLPFATWITGRPAFGKMVVYFVILAVMTWYRRRGGRRIGKNTMAAVGILMLGILFFTPEHGFEIDILDVGQGDGSFLRTQSGYTIFVDGGSTDVKQAGEYRILPFLKSKGIRSIDYWIVSHTDADHISGLEEILESGYPIRYLIFAEGILEDEPYERLMQLAEEQGVDRMYLERQDTLHLGEATLRVISPDAAMDGDKNAKSLVVLYEEGAFSALFTGDIGIAEEKRILNQQELEAVVFYKAAHHGSKNSNSAEFLNQLSPIIASVSCSRKNRYGHPGADAVTHMEEAGSSVFYTMEAGQIKITMEGGEILVHKYRNPLEEFRFCVVE